MPRARVAAGILAMLLSVDAVADIFVGVTPCDPPIREFLRIPPKAPCEFVRWDVWPALGVNGHPSRLRVTAEYGVEGKAARRIQREGNWAVDRGTPEHPDGRLLWIELRGREMRLWNVGPHTVHFLDEHRNLLVGDARHGYMLATAFSESPRQGGPPLELHFTPVPEANGPDVFGVFEGRTPCGLSQVVGVSAPARCDKLDWRLTLFQDSGTRALTRYRLEGGLLPAGPREGAIRHRVSTAFNRDASVLELEAAAGEQPVYLMRGDDNVFFFVDRTGNLGVGDRESGYALYRRGASAPNKPADRADPGIAGLFSTR